VDLIERKLLIERLAKSPSVRQAFLSGDLDSRQIQEEIKRFVDIGLHTRLAMSHPPTQRDKKGWHPVRGNSPPRLRTRKS